MRIGELLIEQRRLRPSDLERALGEKPADRRLVSFLIAKGLVDFDDASRALGEQKGVACALSKHLAGRDPSLSRLIPAELGRGSCVLPIGRTSKGHIIVCVRDPAPALLAALRRAIASEVTMVIAPAARLEHLVAEAYGRAQSEELDIDFDMGPMETPLPPSTYVPRRPITTPPAPSPITPPLPDMDMLDPESVRLSLTDLDDVRVDKDPTQSGMMARVGGSTLPPASPPHPKPPTLPPATQPAAPRTATAAASVASPTTMSLESMRHGLEQASTREAATDLVLAFVATRWTAGLVLALRERAAMGYRGHRVASPESVMVSLGSPSTLQRAVQTRSVSVEAPNGVGQTTLCHALNKPSSPAAAPVLVKGQPIAVIAVGDPLDGMSERDAAAADLATIAEALGSAYQRIMSR